MNYIYIFQYICECDVSIKINEIKNNVDNIFLGDDTPNRNKTGRMEINLSES